MQSLEQTKNNHSFIWGTGLQKYKFTLVGEMQLNTMNVKNKVESSLIFHVKDFLNKYADNGLLINIITYDKQMVECSNPGFKEMFTVTRQFEKLYDEIEITIDEKGKLKSIENIQQLKEKWKQIKNDAITYFNDDTDIESFFKLNDATMDDEHLWKKIVTEQEMFFLFFELANHKTSFFRPKIIKRDNAYRNNLIDWLLSYTVKEYPDYTDVSITGEFKPTKNWLQQSYGSIPFLTNIIFEPQFKIEGQYIFNKENGFIKEAYINIDETAHPQLLFHKLKFQIQSIN